MHQLLRQDLVIPGDRIPTPKPVPKSSLTVAYRDSTVDRRWYTDANRFGNCNAYRVIFSNASVGNFHHQTFDQDLIGIDPESLDVVAPKHRLKELRIEQTSPLNLPETPAQRALEWRWETFRSGLGTDTS